MVFEPLQSLTDEQAVERVLAGETGLYELLMRRYNQRLYRISRSALRNDPEAEDVVQDAWVRAYEHLDRFSGGARFATWVTKIALCAGLARAKCGEDETPNMEHTELRELLESAVERLPEHYRSVFVLREIEQLSIADTAECLDLSEEAVKTRLHRGRALLRRDLAERIGAVSTEAFPFLGARCDRIVARVMERIGGICGHG